MITLIARIIAKPGKEALLAEECIKIARIVREQEKGCLMYIPHVSANNLAEITFLKNTQTRMLLMLTFKLLTLSSIGKIVES